MREREREINLIENPLWRPKTLADPKMLILSSKISQHLSTNAEEEEKTKTDKKKKKKKKGEGERERRKTSAASLLMMQEEMGR